MNELDRDHDHALLIDAVRFELEVLWSDLEWAVRESTPTSWSIQCENLAERIVTLSRLVGPTPWRKAPVSLLRAGVYERTYAQAGIAFEPVDHRAVEALHERMRTDTRRALGQLDE